MLRGPQFTLSRVSKWAPCVKSSMDCIQRFQDNSLFEFFRDGVRKASPSASLVCGCFGVWTRLAPNLNRGRLRTRGPGRCNGPCTFVVLDMMLTHLYFICCTFGVLKPLRFSQTRRPPFALASVPTCPTCRLLPAIWSSPWSPLEACQEVVLVLPRHRPSQVCWWAPYFTLCKMFP